MVAVVFGYLTIVVQDDGFNPFGSFFVTWSHVFGILFLGDWTHDFPPFFGD
jgi:hypothetical protein